MPALTPEELKARWVAFHQEIRRMAGTPLQRIAGRMLGEDTRRYRLARLIFRPALQAWRNLRKLEKKKAPLVSVGDAPEVYPVNYRPRVIDYAAFAALNVDLSDVSIVEVDEESASPSEFLARLNDTLNETTAEWLFLCDPSTSTESRRYSVSKLLTRASPDDDVVFGDEAGLNQFAPLLKSPAV